MTTHRQRCVLLGWTIPLEPHADELACGHVTCIRCIEYPSALMLLCGVLHVRAAAKFDTDDSTVNRCRC